MPVLDSYLFFNGNCAEAMRFYAATLGGKLEAMMTYGQSPEPHQCPPDSQDRIMHARLLLDGRALMASDVPANAPPEPSKGFALSLGYTAAAEARKVFDALAAGGKVVMPMNKTFWAETFGVVVDRFGTQWMVGGAMQG
jgi:PhnB protein